MIALLHWCISIFGVGLAGDESQVQAGFVELVAVDAQLREQWPSMPSWGCRLRRQQDSHFACASASFPICFQERVGRFADMEAAMLACSS